MAEDRNASVRCRKGQIRGRNGEDGEARGKAVIKHTGANRRCLCVMITGGKVGINRGEWRG